MLWAGGILLLLLLVAAWDILQKKNVIRRNFPIIGHGRSWLIRIGPELRQYIVAHNREEAPFNRLEREWIYHSADRKNNYFGFGTDDQIYGIGYPIIKHQALGHPATATEGNKPEKKKKKEAAPKKEKASARKAAKADKGEEKPKRRKKAAG